MSPELWILARRETGADGGPDLAPLSPALRHCHLTGAVAESQKCPPAAPSSYLRQGGGEHRQPRELHECGPNAAQH